MYSKVTMPDIFAAFLLSANLQATSFQCFSPEEEIGAVDVAVIGEIMFHELDPFGVGNIKFKVLRQWKGEPLEAMEIYASPSFPFRFGESGYYLIFANRATQGEEPSWQIPPCLPVADVLFSPDAFEILGEPRYIFE